MTLEDALHCANNFVITEDKHAFMIKHYAMKILAEKLADTYHEPRQHTSYEKNDKKKYAVAIIP